MRMGVQVCDVCEYVTVCQWVAARVSCVGVHQIENENFILYPMLHITYGNVLHCILQWRQ